MKTLEELLIDRDDLPTSGFWPLSNNHNVLFNELLNNSDNSFAGKVDFWTDCLLEVNRDNGIYGRRLAEPDIAVAGWYFVSDLEQGELDKNNDSKKESEKTIEDYAPARGPFLTLRKCREALLFFNASKKVEA